MSEFEIGRLKIKDEAEPEREIELVLERSAYGVRVGFVNRYGRMMADLLVDCFGNRIQVLGWNRTDFLNQGEASRLMVIDADMESLIGPPPEENGLDLSRYDAFEVHPVHVVDMEGNCLAPDYPGEAACVECCSDSACDARHLWGVYGHLRPYGERKEFGGIEHIIDWPTKAQAERFEAMLERSFCR